MKKKRPSQGFVYLIECVLPPPWSGRGPIKIGRRGWEQKGKRLRSLQVGSPFDLRLLAEIRVDDAAAFEKALHQIFASDCIRGEWFRPSEMLEAYIARFGIERSMQLEGGA